MKINNGQGVSLDFDGLRIGLDSCPKDSDIVFISHAHTDHLIKNPKVPVLTSELTGRIAKIRGYDYDIITSLPGITLVDSGHTAGSKALLIKGDEKVLYTGDFTTHDRFFLKGLKPIKCDTLIIETTYGIPEYDLPLPSFIIKEARSAIKKDLKKGKKVVLWGYAFGKAQILTKLAEGLGEIYAHEQVRKFNSECKDYGINISVPKKLVNNFKGIYITPLKSELKNFENACIYSFTGWNAQRVRGSFPLSDHAGFRDLLKFVRECNPSRVFTLHGFSEEFASLLRAEGFNASSLNH